MTISETITQKVADAGGKLRVRSAINPALWMCAIVTVPCIALIITQYKATVPPIWLIITAIVPVAIAIFGFLFLLIVDRDKLQSEDFQIRKKSL